MDPNILKKAKKIDKRQKQESNQELLQFLEDSTDNSAGDDD